VGGEQLERIVPQPAALRGTMTDRRGFLAAAACAISASAAPALAASPRRSAARRGWIPSARLTVELPGVMGLAALPGLSMAALDRGTLAWQHTIGVADAQTQAPLDQDTLFEAASTSKPVFAYAILQLVERGVIDLDRPLALYRRPPYLPADSRLDRITARHVLTHTSGLRNWGDEGSADTFRPMFEPGERVSYSGEGFFWLQLVAEQLTGQGLDQLMRTQIFEPARMTRSMFALDEEATRNLSFGHVTGRRSPQQGMRDIVGLVTPLARAWQKPVRDWAHEDHVRAAATLDPGRPTQRVRFQNAAASLFTTAGDYARFLVALMDGAPRAAWHIGAALRREMIAPLVAVREGAPLWRGLGWSVERCGGESRFGHEGNNDGRFTAYVGAEASTGRGLVVLTNGDAGFGVYQRIVRAVTGCDQLSFVAALA
jgi:CubicO group peptidase (beta-lactamase class C family)